MMREALNFFFFKGKSSLLGREGESKGAGGSGGRSQPVLVPRCPSRLSPRQDASDLCLGYLLFVLLSKIVLGYVSSLFTRVLKVQTVSSPSSPGGYPVEAGTASRSSSQRSCLPKAGSQEEAVDFCSWPISSAWGEGSAWCWWRLLRVRGSSWV